MAVIRTANGTEVLVDDADYAWLSQWRWHILRPKGRPYAARRESGTRKKRGAYIYMHQAIAMPSPGLQVDHVNGNTLDNRRKNLRACTRSQNNMNTRPRKGCRSRFKGVCWRADRHRWKARITAGGKVSHLGLFETEEEAARAYNNAARRLHGQFARLNEI